MFTYQSSGPCLLHLPSSWLTSKLTVSIQKRLWRMATAQGQPCKVSAPKIRLFRSDQQQPGRLLSNILAACTGANCETTSHLSTLCQHIETNKSPSGTEATKLCCIAPVESDTASADRYAMRPPLCYQTATGGQHTLQGEALTIRNSTVFPRHLVLGERVQGQAKHSYFALCGRHNRLS